MDETFWCENLKETTCWVERTIQMVNYRLISLALPLMEIPGVGPVIATAAVSTMGESSAFCGLCWSGAQTVRHRREGSTTGNKQAW